jgi:hypothetical protein
VAWSHRVLLRFGSIRTSAQAENATVEARVRSIAALDESFNDFVQRALQLFGFGEVAGAPHVPAGDGAPWLPFFCAAMHDVGFGKVHGGDFVGGFEFAEGEGEAFADAVIVDGEDIGAAEAEDEEHFYGPATDAADLCEVFDDGFVGHTTDVFEIWDGAVDGFGGEVAEGEHLVFGEAGGAELLVGAVEELLRGGMGASACGFERHGRREALDHAAMDGGGGLAVELLIDDAFGEGFEGGLGAGDAEFEGACALDEFAESGIVCGEFAAGESAVVARRARVVAVMRHMFDGIARAGRKSCELQTIRTGLVAIYKSDTFRAG